jgi:DNA repair exonuclease SbcCD nuclease subunit
MRFQFIHAADLHIDSPLAALGLKDARIAATFAAAGRRAVEQLVEATIESGSKFLIVAGDVFDGDWRDVSTGLFFVRELGRLDRAGVKTFLIKGNHDAENRMSRRLDYPASAHVFDARRCETRHIEELRVALHGRSFADREAPPDFLSSYAPRREGWLNIGLLHTSLEGAPGHDPYAPCKVEDLARFGYDYWALGHIHAAAIVARDPWIVYPGNLQGRHARETGPKGAMRVSVEDGRVVAVEPIPLDAARWAHEQIDVTGLVEEEAVLARIGETLAEAARAAEGRPLAVRITLSGETPAHARLVARRDELLDEARGRAVAAGECWVEKLRLETRPPAAPPADADAFDVAGLLADAADEEFVAEIAALAASVADKLPRELRDAFLAIDPALRAAEARDLVAGARA